MLRFKSIYIEEMKSNIHPTYYKDAKVISAGKVIFTTGATVPEIRVDIHSGNHPFKYDFFHSSLSSKTFG